METKNIINFSMQHLEPITEPNDCCICLTPSDRQTKKCSHPICVECFYKLTDNDTKKIPCPICRKVLVKRKHTRKNGSSTTPIDSFHTFNPLHHLPIVSMNGTNIARMSALLGRSSAFLSTDEFIETSVIEQSDGSFLVSMESPFMRMSYTIRTVLD
jgi:hypothetical protein